MKQFYTLVVLLALLNTRPALAQSGAVDCTSFSATYTTTESRCASTGSITANASGGSGDYGYKVTGPVTTPITSSATITGLAPGTYELYIKDMTTGCIITIDNVVVTGSYADPRFLLNKTDVTCEGASNGTISVTGQTDGRGPFTYTIIAPSPSGVGTTSNTGDFSNLPAGRYFVQLRDSCGGIQTRSVTIQDYNWWINTHTETKINCTTVSERVYLIDNQGKTNTAGTAFNGFSYGVVNAPGDTVWYANYSFSYSQSPLRTVTFVVKDRCGLVKSFSWTNTKPALGASVTTNNYQCSTFNANITSPSNLTSPQYTLKQGATVIATNSTGSFTNIPYGSYCIEMQDACYDTTITRCFNVNTPKPSVGSSVSISNRQCSTFTATVTGQNNLFNPQYCLYTGGGALITCNATGVFTNVPYGSYSIRVTSAAPCYDTTIVRNFTENMPVPTVAANVSISNQNCNSFTASVTGQNNLFNPQYCLYDNLGNLITCNTSGSFSGVPYGNYCIRIISAAPCYDTTITRCFAVAAPSPSAANPNISNEGCTTFTVTIPSVTNISMPNYCLYDNGNNLITCNGTGTFNNVPYGSYCIVITSNDTASACPLAPVTKCFSVSKPAKSVNNWVRIRNKDCTSFSAEITGQTNLTNPQYCLYDSLDNLIACQSSDRFNNLLYGSYCIRITDDCADTTITRCFTVTKDVLSISAQASASCTINSTNIKVTPTDGESPYTASIINPGNVVIATQTFSSSSYTFPGLPPLGPGLQYKVAITDNCGGTDTVLVTPQESIFSRVNSLSGKCPSADKLNGASDLNIGLTSNMGLVSPMIIKKNNNYVVINYNNSNYVNPTYKTFTFNDLDPATYVIRYYISSCSMYVYDTVTVSAYQYPSLANSAAYQCDNNNFSVNAVASGGVAPYAYEIIGSAPASPSIVTAPQASPIFDITNGTNYSLVRMRVVDACGNGSLNDVSVLPLGTLSVTASTFDCYYNNITLTVDTIPNATYTWYKKTSPTDSVQVATTQGFNLPYLLPSDTGTYVARTSVNNGCLSRVSYYTINGDCGGAVLPVRITRFAGALNNNQVNLEWDVAGEYDMKEYVVQRRTAAAAAWTDLGSVRAINASGGHRYTWTDYSPMPGNNEYRLKMTNNAGKTDLSNIVVIRNGDISISVVPNPVKETLRIRIASNQQRRYEIRLYGSGGELVYKGNTGWVKDVVVSVPRSGAMKSGLYVVKITDPDSGETFTQKLIYQ